MPIPEASQLVPWVVFIPLIGLGINLLFGKWFKEGLVGAVAVLASLGAFVVAVLLGLGLKANPEAVVRPLAVWAQFDNIRLEWAFRVDTLSVWMMLVVAGVGTLIHFYSIGYMHSDVRHNGDPSRFRRFFIYLNLFIVAMMVLVSANNFFMLFVGWEGVGLCSYLLIGFWFEKGAEGTANAKAAKKAFIVNRVGDFGMLLAIFLMAATFGSLDFEVVFQKAAGASPQILLAITLLLLLAVAGKSAQLPLFVWLPDAMAGPTPVSALIHAATMVTAGVYLIVRSQALYIASPTSAAAVMWVGTLTAILGALVAVGQFDIKKVLAYSTISQLGFMVAAAGMGAWVAAMFHLTTHAFFKGLLFLAAGSIILGMEHGHKASASDAAHSGDDPQDMRNMGGLRAKMPITFTVYLIGALALAGIVPLSGFFSKDEILTAASHYPPVFILLGIAALLTAFYMTRQVLMIFFGRGHSHSADHAVESGAIITIPLIILAALSVVGGELNVFPSYHLEHWLEHTLQGIHPSLMVPWVMMVASLLAISGILLGGWLYARHVREAKLQVDPLQRAIGPLFTSLQKRWFDRAYQAIFVGPYYKVSDWLSEVIDHKVIDGFIEGIGSVTEWTSGQLRKIQNGYVRTYALAVLFGAVILIGYLLLH
jgi:NADH-quinone oxidoreductase subunit L